MARSSWNPHSPDSIGVEFFGVGVANNVLSATTDAYALQFHPQQTGFISSIAVYSGALTNNPGITNPNYFFQRRPWIVELIPVSGYDPGAVSTSFFFNFITASTDCVDESFTAVDGDELNDIGDGLALFQSGPNPATATVQYDSTGFPSSGVQILTLAIEVWVNRQAYVLRIDQDSGVGWSRLFPPGYSVHHMAEAFRDHGTSGYSLWTPTMVRQFDDAVGNRRLKFQGVDIQPMEYDYLDLHVDYIPERRAGVAVIVPNGPYEWTTANLVRPGTSNPVPVTAGGEYMVVVRSPSGQNDYGSPGSRFDFRSLNDPKFGGVTPVHYTSLDWNSYLPKKSSPWAAGVYTRGLDTLLQGLPAIRMLNGTTELVDSEPYSNNWSGARPLKSTNTTDRVKHTFAIISGTTKYRYVKQNVALIKGPDISSNPGHVDVRLVNNVGTVIAGPAQITTDLWDASPKVGTDIFGDEYHTVTVDLGTSVDIADATATTVEYILSDDAILPDADDGTSAGNPWRIGALVSEIIAATGSDQTAPSNASARGFVYSWADSITYEIDSPPSRRGDLQALLISEVPPITGTSVVAQSQMVSGGVCDPCNITTNDPCLVRGLTYNHVCWSPTTLKQDQFTFYEVQRLETAMMDAAWTSVAFIIPTGAVVSGAAVTGAPHCFDDWSHVYDTPVQYRVRQRRVDGGYSDFTEVVTITTSAPTGADLIITAPLRPDLNVAFPEAYTSLPITKEWESLDADLHTYRQVYGRDNFVEFRPIETLGLRFKRRLTIAALCTPVKPCIDVVHTLHEICQETTGLVVRDTCGNRWYAGVQVPTFTQLHDPGVGDIWFADIIVTEVATPVLTAMNVGEVQP